MCAAVTWVPMQTLSLNSCVPQAEAQHPSAYLSQFPLAPRGGGGGVSSLSQILGPCSKCGLWRNCQGQGSMGIVGTEFPRQGSGKMF